MARAGFKQTLDLFSPPSCFCSSQRNHFQLAVEVQDKRGDGPRQGHNYHRLGFNHTLLRLLSAHYLTPNTTAPLPETGQFSPLMSLRILAVMDNHRRGGGSESWDIIIHHILSHLIFFFFCSRYPFLFLYFGLLISLKMCQFDLSLTKPWMIYVKRLQEEKEVKQDLRDSFKVANLQLTWATCIRYHLNDCWINNTLFEKSLEMSRDTSNIIKGN